MRPILFEIPAIPYWGWVLLLAGFFGLSAYWGARDAAVEGGSDEERRRRARSAVLFNAALFLAGAVLLWRFRESIARPLPVRAYGFLLMLAFAVGMVYVRRMARGSALTSEGAVDLILGLLLVAVVSSRLLYILLNRGNYSGHWAELFRVWEGGLSFHGGLAGGFGWVLWYAWRHRLRFWWLADLMSPGLALGYAVARVGCFLNGCCYGTPTHLPWAVRFQDPPLSGLLTQPSHPVQIYATLTNLAIFGGLLVLLRRKRFDGQAFGWYLVLYSAYRFAVEALRKGVTGQVLALGMTQAQWASLAIAALGFLIMAYLRRRPQPEATGAGDRSRRQEQATGAAVVRDGRSRAARPARPASAVPEARGKARRHR